ncbi:MAG TPA: hypothetical protein VE526_01290 [Solirubrobacteraceae bacterium]|nr:hypothetical protein [Solirubrobacteraceae bacterium]
MQEMAAQRTADRIRESTRSTRAAELRGSVAHERQRDRVRASLLMAPRELAGR